MKEFVAAAGKLQQETCNQGDTQLFRMEPLNDAFGGVRIASKLPGPRCLDVPGGEATDNLRIQDFPCHQGINQRWLHSAPGGAARAVWATPIARVTSTSRPHGRTRSGWW